MVAQLLSKKYWIDTGKQIAKLYLLFLVANTLRRVISRVTKMNIPAPQNVVLPI